MNDQKIAKKRISFHKSEALNKNSYKKFESKDKRYFVRDKKLEGFWVRVYPSGAKSYGITTRKGGVGKPKLTTIGSCDLIAFEDAKETARQYLKAIKVDAINPKIKIKEQAMKNKTIMDLVNDYLDERRDSLSDYTKKDYKVRLENRMKPLLKIPVAELTVQDIKDWWKKSQRKRSDELAFIYARKAIDVAVGNEYLDSNPFVKAKQTIEFGEIPKRESHVSKVELSDFFSNFISASKQMKSTIRDYLVFVLVTGKRKGEAESLSWDNIDFKNGTITLPITKNKKIDVVPMTDFLYIFLKSRQKEADAHKRWVFPTHYTSGVHAGKHISSPYKSLKKIEGFNITVHDFRRTFSTALKELGIANSDISSLLNHSKKDVTEGYIFRSLEYKESNLKAVVDYYNSFGDDALSWMLVNWYGGNSNLFTPSPEHTEDILDRDKQREYLLAENED
ncbi:integrase family protein [Gammaproteobacteria bacterium]|nr:integrase family protein [Gammaproteobacteria bacterium]